MKPRKKEPMNLSAVAAEISKLQGVVGVFRGLRHRRGELTNEPVLSVHVRRKRRKSELAKGERIAERFPGVEIDIVPVGRPRLHAEVDSNDQLVAAYDELARMSAVSALAKDASGAVIGLGSGHGLLPVANGSYQSGAWDPSVNRVYVDSDPSDTNGGLSFGSINESVDFAVVVFQRLEPPVALLGHTLASLPIPTRSTSLSLGEVLQQEAPKRRYRVTGKVSGLKPSAPVVFRTDEGFEVRYADVVTVTGTYVDFSLPGESGSMVFDGNRRAVGFVVGGGKDPDNPSATISYVLCNFAALKQQMGSTYSLFFGAT